jgi:hypothetical protein
MSTEFESQVPDSQLQETQVPESQAPESQTIDVNATPDVHEVSESAVAETSTKIKRKKNVEFESQVPESQVPESQVPESQSIEVNATLDVDKDSDVVIIQKPKTIKLMKPIAAFNQKKKKLCALQLAEARSQISKTKYVEMAVKAWGLLNDLENLNIDREYNGGQTIDLIEFTALNPDKKMRIEGLERILLNSELTTTLNQRTDVYDAMSDDTATSMQNFAEDVAVLVLLVYNGTVCARVGHEKGSLEVQVLIDLLNRSMKKKGCPSRAQIFVMEYGTILDLIEGSVGSTIKSMLMYGTQMVNDEDDTVLRFADFKVDGAKYVQTVKDMSSVL